MPQLEEWWGGDLTGFTATSPVALGLLNPSKLPNSEFGGMGTGPGGVSL